MEVTPRKNKPHNERCSLLQEYSSGAAVESIPTDVTGAVVGRPKQPDLEFSF